MANITADTQVFEYPLVGMIVPVRLITFLLFFLANVSLVAQLDDSNDKKATKYFDRAEEFIKDRDFPSGILFYKKAIQRDPDFIQAYKRLAMSYEILRMMDSSFNYYDQYQEKAGIENLPQSTAFFLVDLYLKQGEYLKAAKLFSDYPIVDTGDKKYLLLQERINFILPGIEKPFNFQVELLPDSVNRFFNQYFPTVTVDNTQLIFTKRSGTGYMDDEDLVISHFKDDHWTEATSISEKINTSFNEGACTISADGRTLIFTSCEEENSMGSCDLFISFKTGESWSKPRNLGPTVNSIYWDSQPSLSADGRVLYFSSNRPGGHGGRDLWMSKYEKDQWKRPVNAGARVNTSKDEVTPYLHFNNQTLIFSSAGHLGFGGFDLFKAEIEDSLPGSPVNLGFGINNELDQISMTIAADGTYGLFAQEFYEEQGGRISKLAKVNFNENQIIQNEAVYVTGNVLDKITKEPVKAIITLNDLSSEVLTYQTQSDGLSGSFYFVLTQGSSYGVFVKARGYLFEDFTFDVQSQDAGNPDSLAIYLQPLRVDAQLTLENIYFEFDSYDLSNKSRSELSNISKFLKANKIQVEISGHTDSQGLEDYNQDLSEKRAKTVYDYLLKLGVSGSKMTFAGYGSDQLLIEGDPENPENRRIDFRILAIHQ